VRIRWPDIRGEGGVGGGEDMATVSFGACRYAKKTAWGVTIVRPEILGTDEGLCLASDKR